MKIRGEGKTAALEPFEDKTSDLGLTWGRKTNEQERTNVEQNG